MNCPNKLKKIFTPNVAFSPADFSPEEKRLLLEFFDHHGLSGIVGGKGYKRFFDKGFDEWELMGTDAVKRQYIRDNEVAIWRSGERGNATHPEGYAGVLALGLEDNGAFWAVLTEAKLISDFCASCPKYGISQTTASSRFREDNFLPWEKAGIRQMMHEFAEYAANRGYTFE